jgi:hypothetical protein
MVIKSDHKSTETEREVESCYDEIPLRTAPECYEV